ncbi:hypothetical protein OG223_16680 [Streptomyces sp. NBC_01478]|uniref:hypothetical protein n=1 Tax=Streptomyces sp. NBC_01478 TaxID=2903882 RepID=UPI002E332E6C|nr:hypothetical protein [Streptomyces sp. NBC_01478]
MPDEPNPLGEYVRARRELVTREQAGVRGRTQAHRPPPATRTPTTGRHRGTTHAALLGVGGTDKAGEAPAG